MGSETISICANYTHTTLLLGNLPHNMFVAFCWYRSRLLQACCHGNSEGVVSVLCEEETEEDRTALVNCKSSVSGSPETRSPGGSVGQWVSGSVGQWVRGSVGPRKPGLLVGQWVSGSPETRSAGGSVGPQKPGLLEIQWCTSSTPPCVKMTLCFTLSTTSTCFNER